MAYDLINESKKRILKAAEDRRLSGDEERLSIAISAIVQCGISLRSFLPRINKALADKNLVLRIPQDGYSLIDSRDEASSYTVQMELFNRYVSEDREEEDFLDAAHVELKTAGSSLMSSALLHFATMGDDQTDEFLTWAFEAGLPTYRGKAGYESQVEWARANCNKLLADMVSENRVAVKFAQITDDEDDNHKYEAIITKYRITDMLELDNKILKLNIG
jgi:hypothetical protein